MFYLVIALFTIPSYGWRKNQETMQEVNKACDTIARMRKEGTPTTSRTVRQ